MIKGTTSIGFEFEIDERKGKDQRLSEVIVLNAKMAKTNDPVDKAEIGLKAYDLMKSVIGEEIQSNLYKFLDERDGYVDSDVFAKTLGEIISICRNALSENERKNSTSSSVASLQTRMPSSATSQKPMGYTIIPQSPSPSQQPYAQDSETRAELKLNSAT